MFPVTKLRGLPYRSGPEDPRWMDASAEWPALERALDEAVGELAAVVYEPVLQAAGGMRLYSPDLLRRLRAWADARGVFLIADEIAAGMGRCGAMLASHLALGPPSGSPNPPASGSVEQSSPSPTRLVPGALPDFAVMSKGLTAGFLPLSAVLTTDAIYRLFDADYAEGRAFLHSNTYTGNALGVAVANAVLDVFADDDILARVAAVGPRLRAALGRVAATRRCLANLRGCGMVAAVDLRTREGGTLDPARRTGYRVYREAVQRGALLRPLGDTLYLFPPLTVTDEEIAEMTGILADSVDVVV
jgi:adenosylmethionine-8-amino-7-oxononanoate aminotransferase